MSKEEPVELCVILPYAEYRSIEQRAKKGDSNEVGPTSPERSLSPTFEESVSDSEGKADSVSSQEPIEVLPIPTEKAKKKELKNTFRATQIKKLLSLIEKKSNSKEVSTLENLDSLIKSALGTGQKILPNEKQFFTFLFENNLGHFVRNRKKINLYYKFKDNWWAV